MKRLTRLDIIEILLALAALITGLISALTGNTTYQIKSISNLREGVQENVANSLESGLDGAALGFAIIAACCIVMITWIEITRFKRNDNQ